jgi:hypothetical protein
MYAILALLRFLAGNLHITPLLGFAPSLVIDVVALRADGKGFCLAEIDLLEGAAGDGMPLPVIGYARCTAAANEKQCR